MTGSRREDGLVAAAGRLDAAMARLEASLAALRERSGAAGDLERAERLDAVAGEVAERLEAAIGTVRSVLENR